MAQLEHETKKTDVSMFKKLSFWLSKSEDISPSTNKKVDSEADLMKKQISNSIDLLIEGDMLINVFEVIGNGYSLTKEQEIKIKNKLGVSPHSVLSMFEILLVNDYSIPEEFLISAVFLKEFGDLTISHNNTKAFPYLLKLYTDKFEEKDFSRKVFEGFSDIVSKLSMSIVVPKKEYSMLNTLAALQAHMSKQIENNTYVVKKINYLLDNNLIFKGGTLNEYLEAVSHISTTLNKVIEAEKFLKDIYVQNYSLDIQYKDCVILIDFVSLKKSLSYVLSESKNKSSTLFKNDIKELLKNTKKVFGDEYLQTQTIKNQISHIKAFSLNELPTEAYNALEKIKTLYTELNKNDLSLEDKTNIEFLYETKVPDLIQRFASMHTDYRETMKSVEGKNSYELVTDSLLDIQHSLQSKLEMINENHLSGLSATNRYTRGLRN